MCCNATTLSSSIQVQDRKRKQQRSTLDTISISLFGNVSMKTG
jgi:hypothetical protein